MQTKNTEIQQLRVYSISYEKANAETRGRFSFFMEQLPELAETIKANNAGFGFIVSTCNRTEIYTYTTQPDFWINSFCKIINVEKKEFLNYANFHEGEAALQHLFGVSAGLKSQILGDFEIISQLKKWVRKCKKQQLTNHYLERAVNTALQISKKIKKHTDLSNGTASVSFSAVNFLLHSDTKFKKIILLGTGKIGQNTCHNLVKHLPNIEIVAINRTEEKAEKLAQKYKITHQKFDKLSEQMQTADAIIVSTNATEAIIDSSYITNKKSLIILDLSIPNNVERSIAENKNVSLLNVDDLSKMVDKTLETRTKEIPKAEKIIAESTLEFLEWEESRKFAPIIHQFKEKLDFINDFNAKNLRKNNIHINGNETMLANKLAQKMTNRFADYILENPEKADETAQLFQNIFQIENK